MIKGCREGRPEAIFALVREGRRTNNDRLIEIAAAGALLCEDRGHPCTLVWAFYTTALVSPSIQGTETIAQKAQRWPLQEWEDRARG